MALLKLAFYLTLFSLSRRMVASTACEDKENFFACSADKRCIEKHELCDGFEDCLDGEDETIGCEMKYNCTGPLKFLCKDHKCILQIFRCDGVVDCDDQSDEENCPANNTHCSLNRDRYLCKHKYQCIDLLDVCNNRKDCEDGSDEGGLCANSHLKGCRCDKCMKTPDGTVCICKEGFEPMNNKTCKDIDECSLGNVCDHACTNIEGSYKCSCHKFFVLQEDGRSCSRDRHNIGTEMQKTIVYVTPEAVKSVDVPSFKKQTLVSHSKNMNNFPQCDTSGEPVCYLYTSYRNTTTLTLRKIELFPPSLKDGSIEFNVLGIHKFCHSYSHILRYSASIHYFLCPQEGIVVCTSLDSKSKCSLIRRQNKNTIKILTFSPLHGLLFWLEVTPSETVQIVRASMSGSNERVLLRDSLTLRSELPSLAVDTIEKRLYYFNFWQSTIESIKFDGTDRQVIKSNIFSPLALAVLNRYELVWSTNDTNSHHFSSRLFSCNKKNGKDVEEIIVHENSTIVSIMVPDETVSYMKDKLTVPACYDNSCSDLCLPSSENVDDVTVATSACACPILMIDGIELATTLSVDGILCKETTILASNVMQGARNNLFVIGGILEAEPKIIRTELNFIGSISAMTYNPLQGDVFIFDSVQKTLFTYNLKQTVLNELKTNFGMVTVMTYDGLGNNLFLCNWETQSIEVLSLNTMRKAVLIEATDNLEPSGFALAFKEGKIFVAFSGNSANVSGEVFSISLEDTTRRESFLNNFLDPGISRLVYNEQEEVIWFTFRRFPDVLIAVDTKNYSIEEGTRKSGFYTMDDNLADLTFVNGTLFYATEGSAKIEWIDALNRFQINPNMSRIDLMEEQQDFLINSQLRLASVPSMVNISSPCFKNNGGCEHVCLIVNITTHAKRCLCESNRTLASDGLHCIPRHLIASSSDHTGMSFIAYIVFIFPTSVLAALLMYCRNRTYLRRHPLRWCTFFQSNQEPSEQSFVDFENQNSSNLSMESRVE